MNFSLQDEQAGNFMFDELLWFVKWTFGLEKYEIFFILKNYLSVLK